VSVVDDSHDPALLSWVESANGGLTDFPIQNLPFGRFRRAGSKETRRIGVAIGDQVLDLKLAREQYPWTNSQDLLLKPLAEGNLNAFMALGPKACDEVRSQLSSALRVGSELGAFLEGCLIPRHDVAMSLPCTIGDYTDFYTGIHHATAVGKLFRPDAPLLPNYKWVPIGYHGRSSSVVVSGQSVVRPHGQTKGEGDEPVFAPTRRLDYELELGAVVGIGNQLGDPVSMTRAEQHLFGVVLLNDWSARDMQAWEAQPLGPFLSKSFASTISPWVVTMSALAPYRVAPQRAAGDPAPLAYLDGKFNREQGGLDISLEVWLQTAEMRQHKLPAVRLMGSNFRDAYWTLAQLVAHHTSNGCNLHAGDLLGTGTQSGPGAGQGGSLLELTSGGKVPLRLPNGETRTFLEDGDTVTLRAFCAREGLARIGFGECKSIVGAARPRSEPAR
jgi:fumarylacetoacetase